MDIGTGGIPGIIGIGTKAGGGIPTEEVVGWGFGAEAELLLLTGPSSSTRVISKCQHRWKLQLYCLKSKLVSYYHESVMRYSLLAKLLNTNFGQRIATALSETWHNGHDSCPASTTVWTLWLKIIRSTDLVKTNNVHKYPSACSFKWAAIISHCTAYLNRCLDPHSQQLDSYLNKHS